MGGDIRIRNSVRSWSTRTSPGVLVVGWGAGALGRRWDRDDLSDSRRLRPGMGLHIYGVPCASMLQCQLIHAYLLVIKITIVIT
jgi:hypothetical protein